MQKALLGRSARTLSRRPNNCKQFRSGAYGALPEEILGTESGLV